MKRLFIILLLLGLILPARAMDITAPEVTGEAGELMPEEQPSFGEGLWYIIKTAVKTVRPELADCCRLCLSVVAVTMLMALLGAVPGKVKHVVGLAGCIGVSVLLLSNVNTLIHAAVATIEEISDYGKLLLPVIAASGAAQGFSSHSAALYAGTAFFDSVLGSLISSILVPIVYMYLALTIAGAALGEDFLKRLKEGVKWLATWSLKMVLYIFTGYISITGVLAGSADKTALKAAKVAISGAVPVVGGIMSDASEAILTGTGVVKNTVGTYGMTAVIAIVVLPFLRVGIMYLLLKGTAAICGVFSDSKLPELLQGFSEAMGFLLGMTGTVCLLFLISIVCFVKGVSV